ncbi:hypothetical protein ACI2K4_32675 [Micromonospora sp. NPDC050397]|uniref:hypothetical protein n=1 Tax=Micromonospora sp. NPDC050397 TaxID=3364279 RepID=UPI00384EC825
MDSGFWLGLLLALPIGILTNILTPRVQQWFAGRSARARTARDREREADEAFASDLRTSEARYLSYVYRNIVRLLTYVLVITMIANLPFYLYDTLDGIQNLIAGGHVAEMIPIIITLVTLISLTTAFLNTSRRTNRVTKLVSGEVAGRRSGRDISSMNQAATPERSPLPQQPDGAD